MNTDVLHIAPSIHAAQALGRFEDALAMWKRSDTPMVIAAATAVGSPMLVGLGISSGLLNPAAVMVIPLFFLASLALASGEADEVSWEDWVTTVESADLPRNLAKILTTASTVEASRLANRCADLLARNTGALPDVRSDRVATWLSDRIDQELGGSDWISRHFRTELSRALGARNDWRDWRNEDG